MKHFIRGLFIVGPLALTLAVLSWVVALVDRWIGPMLGAVRAPGMGFALAVLIVFVVGWLGGNLFVRHLIELVEEALLKVPVFGRAYSVVKQLTEAFAPEGEGHGPHSGLVAVEFPRPGVWSLGFVTRRLTAERDGKHERLAAVYVPTNHMYIGDVILVPEEKVYETGQGQAAGVQALVSGGASLPESLRLSARSTS